MFPLRPFPVAVASLLLVGCLCTQEERGPTADELHELSLEELLEIPIETVRSVFEDALNAPASLASVDPHASTVRGDRGSKP